MKKNYYRITMYDGADESFCSKIISGAAKSNGGQEISMATLKQIGDAQKLLYPVLYPDVNCEVIGDSILHVDRKIGDIYKTVLAVEKVEIFDLNEIPETEEEEAIL